MEFKIKTVSDPDGNGYIATIEGGKDHNFKYLSGCEETELKAIKELCIALISALEIEIEDGYLI